MIDILPEPITNNTKIVERCNNNKQFHEIREQIDKLTDLKDIYDLKEK